MKVTIVTHRRRSFTVITRRRSFDYKAANYVLYFLLVCAMLELKQIDAVLTAGPTPRAELAGQLNLALNQT